MVQILCKSNKIYVNGKKYDIDLKEAQKKTLANPKLSKYFL
jgi:hypothetical protein